MVLFSAPALFAHPHRQVRRWRIGGDTREQQ
ncbi:hypothetical protein M6B38_126315 [Iris pallida]|uniref:Uncharacterized protein n=1 Tax=Iris pallida TaxID=29817 RepID=A0AAX6GLD8_IRIPA|nr:hypothetical protein M6B38_357830 [Iris pallida]KAJ6829999.1 hypothetical protein M6B38_126315 [Iris pallida]